MIEAFRIVADDEYYSNSHRILQNLSFRLVTSSLHILTGVVKNILIHCFVVYKRVQNPVLNVISTPPNTMNPSLYIKSTAIGKATETIHMRANMM